MAISYIGAYDLTKMSNDFLRKYGKGGLELYDSKTVVLSQIKKTFDHTGEAFYDRVDLSLGGGVGSNSLPTATNWDTAQLRIPRKSMYYRTRVQREAIYASKDQGAFTDTMRRLAKRGPSSFARNVERAMFADYATDGSNNVVGSGILGVASGVVDADPVFTLTIATGFRAANFEVGDVINIEAGNTDQFEVQSIDTAATEVVVERNSGTQVPVATDELFMQGSEDTDILGITSLCDFVSGDNLYGEAHGYRWGPTRKDASSAGITVERMDEVVLEIDEITGQGIDLIVCHQTQWRKLSAQLQDLKRYTKLEPKSAVKGHTGFKGIEYVHPSGMAPVVTSRFCQPDRMYFLNTNFLELKHSGGFGWFADDRTIFLREADSDSYEARYGGYMELFGIPTFQGVLYNLAT